MVPSYKILDAWCYFIHPALILWLTSSSTSLDACSIDPKYRNVSFLGTTWPSKLTSPSSCVVVLESHLIYSVLILLSLKPFDSRVSRHNSSFLFTLARLPSTSTISSAKSIHQGISPCMSLVTSSITKANR
ncbi:hypothetical protein SEVIR_6G157201v4 [Setaria viridis]